MKNKKAFLVALAVLFVPSLFYLVLRTGKNHYKQLEIFGPRMPNPEHPTDTLFHTIGDFNLTDQYGRHADRKIVEGKIYVADFFFATCKTICPRMTENLARVQERYKNDSSVIILSHTVNPLQDTVEALNVYAQKYGAIKDKWFFLTGDKEEIYRLARQDYFITAMQGDGGPNDFIHSEQFALIDKEGRIRGYYDGTDPFSVDTLVDEIKVLQLEYSAR